MSKQITQNYGQYNEYEFQYLVFDMYLLNLNIYNEELTTIKISLYKMKARNTTRRYDVAA